MHLIGLQTVKLNPLAFPLSRHLVNLVKNKICSTGDIEKISKWPGFDIEEKSQLLQELSKITGREIKYLIRRLNHIKLACDASGNTSDSTPPMFDAVAAPLESIEMKADQTTGRALLLRAAVQVVTTPHSISGPTANVTLREELHKSLDEATGSYLFITVIPTGTIHFGETESAKYWESLRWHSLDMFDVLPTCCKGLQCSVLVNFAAKSLPVLV